MSKFEPQFLYLEIEPPKKVSKKTEQKEEDTSFEVIDIIGSDCSSQETINGIQII